MIITSFCLIREFGLPRLGYVSIRYSKAGETLGYTLQFTHDTDLHSHTYKRQVHKLP